MPPSLPQNTIDGAGLGLRNETPTCGCRHEVRSTPLKLAPASVDRRLTHRAEIDHVAGPVAGDPGSTAM